MLFHFLALSVSGFVLVLGADAAASLPGLHVASRAALFGLPLALFLGVWAQIPRR